MKRKEGNKMMQVSEKHSLIGMAGGILTALYKALQAEDLIRTCVLAITGTVVSFLLSYLLNFVFNKKRKTD